MISKTIIFSAIVASLLLSTSQMAFADSHNKEKLEFAGALEETLGHFWALELNLDENNAELAMVHASHPISELYDTMKASLGPYPAFDEKLQKTLLDLQNKTNTEVSREDAQAAIEEAKKIIEEARMIVVGEELSNDVNFKIQLINNLLETAKVEYREAVLDGTIKEMAEFQDGSSFLWRAQEIFQTIKDDLDSAKIENLQKKTKLVNGALKAKADPVEFESLVDSIIEEFKGISEMDEMSEHHEKPVSELPPLKQIKSGIAPKDVTCKAEMQLIFKPNGNPACVKQSSIEKLSDRGWVFEFSMEPVMCTMEYNPQCGVDGKTYSNPCFLRISGVELDHPGECE